MTSLRWPRGGSDQFRKRINRAPSPFIARGLPWLSIMLASLVPGWLVIASAPVMPPLGFLVLVAWRQLRPGLLPVWAGLPLGLFDDLYSGQPLGSAVLLWSLAIWRTQFSRALPLAGLAIALAALGAQLLGHLRMNVHDVLLLAAGQGIWFVWAGILLLRERSRE